MADHKRRSPMRSFMLGGLVGASAALAAARRLSPRPRRVTPAGLAAFEGAPCFQETLEHEAAAAEAAHREARAAARAARP